MPSTRHAVLGIMLAAGMSLAVPAPGAAEGVPDEAKQAGRDAASFPPAGRGLFPRHGQRRRVDAGRDQGPQHVAGLDRRRRPVLGSHDRPTRSGRSTCSRRSPRTRRLKNSRGQPLDLSWPDQRALLRAGDQGPTQTISACGSTSAAPIARPTRSRRAEISRRRDRRARQEPAGRVLLWRADRHPRPAPVPEPGLRRGGRQELGSRTLLHRPATTTIDKDLVRPYRVGMSCAFCHVGPSPVAPPADPENPKWENISSTVGAQYFWIDRIFAWEAEPAQLHVPARPHLSGRARWTPRWSRPTTSTTRAR